MHVSLQFLQVKIKGMEDNTDFLTDQKERFDDEKKLTDEQNEDLERQLKAKEEANQKRLIAKLTRDKNPDIKELIAKEEEQMQANEDFANKVRTENEKTNSLLDELIQLKENMKLSKQAFDETTKNIQVQDIELK